MSERGPIGLLCDIIINLVLLSPYQDKEREEARIALEKEDQEKEAAKAEAEKKPGFDGTWYTDINAE